MKRNRTEPTIVITGATSMIGVSILDAFLKHGVNAVYAVIRPGSRNARRIPEDPRVRIIECAANQYGTLGERIQEPCDGFFHTAWEGTGSTRNRSTIGQAKNILYTLDALAAAHALGCRAFIGAGSQAEYGRPDLPAIDETTPANPETAYGAAKLAAGKLSLIEAEKLDMDCFWVRIFSVYGRYDKPTTMVSQAIEKMKKNEPMAFTPALQTWDYLYSDDAGEAFWRIFERSKGRKVYCLGSGEARPLKEYILEIQKIVNPEAPVRIGDIPYRGNEVMHLCADISLLRNDTGWMPETSFANGIRRIARE